MRKSYVPQFLIDVMFCRFPQLVTNGIDDKKLYFANKVRGRCMRMRGLTEQETEAARKVFGSKIDYSTPRIIDKRHFLAVRRSDQIIALDGNIYWPRVPANLVNEEDPVTSALFIHEMTHVMQYQCGTNVFLRGLFLHIARLLSCGYYNPYWYRYVHGKPIHKYNIEQQAEIAVGIYFEWFPNTIDV